MTNNEQLNKRFFFFLVFMTVVGIVLMFLVSSAGAYPGYPPTTWTQPAPVSGGKITAAFSNELASNVRKLASAAQPLILGFNTLPDVGSFSEGDLCFLLASPPVLYRVSTGAWAIAGGSGSGGSGGTGDGASMTLSDFLQVGTGTPDVFITRTATGAVTIASYPVIPPETATPTVPEEGTFWNDANTGKVRIYGGSAWHNLW